MFPDIQIGIDDGTCVEGDGFAVAMVRGCGRHDGPFGTIPAWGVLRFDADGRVVSGLLMDDQPGLLVQLGQVPPPS